jgi:DNA-directed RNA polymerase specialized sigma24 family protein
MEPGEPELNSAANARLLALHARLTKAVVAEVERRGLDEQLAEEVEAAVISRLWRRHLEKCEGLDSTELAPFVANKVQDALHERSKRDSRETEVFVGEDDDRYQSTAAPERFSPEASVLGRELTERVAHEMNRWSKARRAPWLLYLNAMAYDEIAAELGISPNTVSTHIRQGREAMRALLQSDYPRLRQQAANRNDGRTKP